MSFRNDIVVDWDVSPRIVEITGDSMSLSIQDLLDTLRTLAADPTAMDDPEIVDASGKENLGEGVFVGITVSLLNARVKFHEKLSPVVCKIVGGNLIAVDEYGNIMNSIEPSTNVTVVIASSSSATLMSGTGASKEEIRDAILDELMENHLNIGTIGKILKDTHDLALLGI